MRSSLGSASSHDGAFAVVASFGWLDLQGHSCCFGEGFVDTSISHRGAFYVVVSQGLDISVRVLTKVSQCADLARDFQTFVVLNHALWRYLGCRFLSLVVLFQLFSQVALQGA